MSVQRIVEDAPAIDLQAEAQHTSGEVENPVSRMNLESYASLLIKNFLLASLSTEIWPNLPIQANPLGKRWFAKSYDA